MSPTARHIEQIQNVAEQILIAENHLDTARAYIVYPHIPGRDRSRSPHNSICILQKNDDPLFLVCRCNAGAPTEEQLSRQVRRVVAQILHKMFRSY